MTCCSKPDLAPEVVSITGIGMTGFHVAQIRRDRKVAERLLRQESLTLLEEVKAGHANDPEQAAIVQTEMDNIQEEIDGINDEINQLDTTFPGLRRE